MIINPLFRRGRFITLAVKTVEVMMNYSNEMQQSFKEMNGLSILVDRADAEVKALLDLASCNDTEMVDVKGNAAGEESVNTVEVDDNSACFVPFIPHRARLEEVFERCRLLGAILHLLSSAASPVASSSDVREFMSGEKVPKILCTIFERNEIFGASVFEKSAGLLTEFVHQVFLLLMYSMPVLTLFCLSGTKLPPIGHLQRYCKGCVERRF